MKAQFQVHWHTGMLLLAQHFQQQDRYLQYKLYQLITSLNPHSYGILDIDMDTSVENQVVIKKLHAVMPSLEPVYLQTQSPNEHLYINLSNDLKEAEDGTYYIYLTMPDADLTHEFSHIPMKQQVTDVINKDMKENITVLQPKLSLLFAQQAPEKLLHIPLLELQVINKQYTISKFEAPFLAWQEDSLIYKKLKQLITQLRNKITYWQRNPERSSHADQIKMGFMSGLALLEEQVLSKAHSYDIFKCILDVIGHVSFLNADIFPRFEYNHMNVTGTFDRCFDYLSHVLSSMHDQYEHIQFKIVNNTYRLKLSENITSYAHLDNPKDRFLIVGTKKFQKKNIDVLKEWINTCVIGSTSCVEHAKRRRVLGAQREIVDIVDSLHIQSSSDYLFFLIHLEEETINMKDDELIIYNENMQIFPDVLEIYVAAKK